MSYNKTTISPAKVVQKLNLEHEWFFSKEKGDGEKEPIKRNTTVRLFNIINYVK